MFAAEAMWQDRHDPGRRRGGHPQKAYDADCAGRGSTCRAIDAVEAVTKHDVIAFLTWAGEKLWRPERRWLHQGMTSSGRARHHARGAAQALGGLADRGHRRAAHRAQEARLGAQVHPDDRPQLRHPRRAGDLRASSRRPTPSSPAAAPGSRPRARRSPLARSAARSAPSPTSPPKWRNTSPTSSASRPSRSRPR